MIFSHIKDWNIDIFRYDLFDNELKFNIVFILYWYSVPLRCIYEMKMVNEKISYISYLSNVGELHILLNYIFYLNLSTRNKIVHHSILLNSIIKKN